ARSSMVITDAGPSLAGEGTDWAADGPTSQLTVEPRDQQTPVTWVSGVRNSAQAAAVQVLDRPPESPTRIRQPRVCEHAAPGAADGLGVQVQPVDVGVALERYKEE